MKRPAGLDAYTALTARDPLFAAEGLDLDQAACALDALVARTNAFERVYRTEHFLYRLFVTRYPLAETLYPLGFLRLFIQSEQSRREFLAAPSLQSARALLEIQKKTARRLLADIRNHRAAQQAALAIGRQNLAAETTYYFFDSAVTANDLFQTIDILEQNALVLISTLEERERLFIHGGIPEIRPARIDPIEAREARALTPEEEMLKVLEERTMQMSIAERFGPIEYELSSFDNRPTRHLFFVYLGSSLRHPERRAFHLLAPGMQRFVSLDPTAPDFHLDKQAMFGPLIERRIPYWFQPATSFYCARDLSYYADLATYIDLIRRPELPAVALRSQKSSLLDYLLWSGAAAADMFSRHAVVLARAGKLTSLFHLFAARSHGSLYYMPFNRSIWRLSEKLVFPGNRMTSQYLRYGDIRSSVTPAQLDDIFAGGKIRREGWRDVLGE